MWHIKLSALISLASLSFLLFTVLHWLSPNLGQSTHLHMLENILSTRLIINTLFVTTNLQRHSVLLSNPKFHQQAYYSSHVS